jgi:hypothetical protein
VFIEFLIDDIMSDDVNEVKLDIRQDDLVKFANIPSAFLFDPHPSKLPVDIALDRYGIEHQSFEDWLKEHDKIFLGADADDPGGLTPSSELRTQKFKTSAELAGIGLEFTGRLQRTIQAGRERLILGNGRWVLRSNRKRPDRRK